MLMKIFLCKFSWVNICTFTMFGFFVLFKVPYFSFLLKILVPQPIIILHCVISSFFRVFKNEKSPILFYCFNYTHCKKSNFLLLNFIKKIVIYTYLLIEDAYKMFIFRLITITFLNFLNEFCYIESSDILSFLVVSQQAHYNEGCCIFVFGYHLPFFAKLKLLN